MLRSPRESSTVTHSNHDRDEQVQTAAAYLESLNPEQRRAVEHGAAGGLAAAPLLVIAGAGSGKTNTLAHRVAHLIVQGADPPDPDASPKPGLPNRLLRKLGAAWRWVRSRSWLSVGRRTAPEGCGTGSPAP